MPLVPLKEHEKIAQIFTVEEVVLTPDADLDIVADLKDFVLVAQTEHFLVFSFLVRIITVELCEFVSALCSLKNLSVNFGSLFHKLSCAIDRIIVKRLVVWLGRL